jgi:hypothetical protein
LKLFRIFTQKLVTLSSKRCNIVMSASRAQRHKKISQLRPAALRFWLSHGQKVILQVWFLFPWPYFSSFFKKRKPWNIEKLSYLMGHNIWYFDITRNVSTCWWHCDQFFIRTVTMKPVLKSFKRSSFNMIFKDF